jgi:alpha-1,2-mannosyltransferase
MAAHIVLRYYRAWLLPPIGWAVGTALLLLVPSVLVDQYFYKKWVVAVVNIAMYNSDPTASDGANLYGTEPWTYYFKNLFLNFNVAFPLALSLFPAVIVLSLLKSRAPEIIAKCQQAVLFSMPFFLWFGLMTSFPHKEERFLFGTNPFKT